MKYFNVKNITACCCLLLLSNCATPPPKQVSNVCSIFRQYPACYWAAQDANKRWYVPIAVQMAIIHQESRFNGVAKPPRQRLLWIIPWKRPSSAYGYTQALQQTWKNYKRSAGRSGADRDAFADAVDFIGWYATQAYHKQGIPRNDAYKLYLAYHEGLGGYARKTYLRKRWLIAVARKVKARAGIFQQQLNHCHKQLAAKPWYRFW